MNLSSYKRIQKFLLTTFFVSVALLVLSVLLLHSVGLSSAVNTNTNTVIPNKNSPTPIDSPAPGNTANTSANANTNTHPAFPSEQKNTDRYVLVIIGTISFLTSLTSLFGFISTTVLAWRKEKRDVEAVRIENEKKELELLKLKMELDKLKAEEKPERKKTPRKAKKSE